MSMTKDSLVKKRLHFLIGSSLSSKLAQTWLPDYF